MIIEGQSPTSSQSGWEKRSVGGLLWAMRGNRSLENEMKLKC
jgi:hypothetical protein